MCFDLEHNTVIPSGLEWRSAVQCTNHYAPASLHEQTEEGGRVLVMRVSGCMRPPCFSINNIQIVKKR